MGFKKEYSGSCYIVILRDKKKNTLHDCGACYNKSGVKRLCVKGALFHHAKFPESKLEDMEFGIYKQEMHSVLSDVTKIKKWPKPKKPVKPTEA